MILMVVVMFRIETKLITTLITDYGNIDVFDEQLAKLPVMSEQLNINSFVSSYRSGYRPLHHLERVLVVCQKILPSSRHVTHIVLHGYQDILPSSRQNHPYRARWLKLGTIFLDLKNHLVDEARVPSLFKHLGCLGHSWTGEPWSMWMLTYIFVANSIFGQFYKGGLFSLMAQRLVGIIQ